MQNKVTALHEPTLPPFKVETLRDLLRILIYGSPQQKTIATELFGAEHLNQSYSRLSKTLQPDPPTFFDIDWLVPTLRTLGPKQSIEFARRFLDLLGLDPNGARPMPKESDAEKLDEIGEALAAIGREVAALREKRGRR